MFTHSLPSIIRAHCQDGKMSEEIFFNLNFNESDETVDRQAVSQSGCRRKICKNYYMQNTHISHHHHHHKQGICLLTNKQFERVTCDTYAEKYLLLLTDTHTETH